MCTLQLNISESNLKHTKNVTVNYGTVSTQFGEFLIGADNHQKLYFIQSTTGDTTTQEILSKLKTTMPSVTFKENCTAIEPFSQIFDTTDSKTLNIHLVGTEFQRNVWKELIKIKTGSTASYEAVARCMGNPKAVRAVANAVAHNKLAFVVPCHRVIRKSGALGNYGGGVPRKKQMLEFEGVSGVF